MAGGFTAGGLISGIDSNSIIRQLLQIERQPITRLENRISTLESEQSTLREFRTQLLGFRSLTQDFLSGNIFGQFQATSSDDTVLGAAISGENPTSGAFTIDVQQLASATVAVGSDRLGASINPAAPLNASGIATPIEGTTFTVNGQTITFDPDAQSLNDVLGAINSSGAGVTATYDASTDRVTIENSTPGDTSVINFGASADTSNFLTAIGVQNATQTTGGSGATQVVSTRNLGAVDPATTLASTNFNNGSVTGGSFFINGVEIAVDPNADSLSDVVARINNSDAKVTASIDSSTDTIRVVSETLGSRTVDFTSGTSNFLDVVHLTTATQTAGSDAEFTVNGGPVQVRNTNTLTDVIGGVTLTLSGVGTSTVNVSSDDDTAVEQVQGFIDSFNEVVQKVRELTGRDGEFENDATIRSVESFLRQTIFEQAGDASDFQTLLDVGISTGAGFSSTGESLLELDEEAFRAALAENRSGVEQLFSNEDEAALGAVNRFFNYLDTVTDTDGALNFRSKANGSIDQQIDAFNSQIDRLEDRLVQREARLRQQFARLEQISANFQSQSTFLSGLGGGGFSPFG